MSAAAPSPALAARQMLVPDFSTPLTLSASGIVSILPVSSAQKEEAPFAFTLGHGPVVVSTVPATATTLSEQAQPFNSMPSPFITSRPPSIAKSLAREHTPTTLKRQTEIPTHPTLNIPQEHNRSAAPTSATTLTRVVKTSAIVPSPTLFLTNSSTSEIEHSYPGSRDELQEGWRTRVLRRLQFRFGYSPRPTRTKDERTITVSKAFTGSPVYLPTNCHDGDLGYIYLTLVLPDGSLALDSERRKTLQYFKPVRRFDDVRKALFNDPRPHHRCPKGNCFSTTIPGTDLRLEHVRNAEIFRSGWIPGQCGYVDGVHKFANPDTSLGDYGYLVAGAVPRVPVVDFIERQVQIKDALAIDLRSGLTLGAFLLFGVALPLAAFFFFKVRKDLRISSEVVKTVGEKITAALRRTVGVVSNAANGCRVKIGNVLWKTNNGRRKQHDQAEDNAISEDQSKSLVDAAAPPAYSSREPSRVFVDIELNHVPTGWHRQY